MYALLLEKFVTEMKYFCEQLYIFQNYIPNMILNVLRYIFTSLSKKLIYMYLYVYNGMHMLYQVLLRVSWPTKTRPQECWWTK